MKQYDIFWNIARNHRKYVDLTREHDGIYCYSCNKPMKRNFNIRCTKCSWNLLDNGESQTKVTFGDVGRSVINYQQYLHRSWFPKTNVHYKYRGVKEERINIKIDQTVLTRSVDKLIRILLSRNNEYITMYREYRHLKPNISKRLLYDITLHFISYHMENSDIFESEAHFMATTMNHIHSSIYGGYTRLIGRYNTDNKKLMYIKRNYGAKYTYRMYEEIELLMEEVIGGLVII